MLVQKGSTAAKRSGVGLSCKRSTRFFTRHHSWVGRPSPPFILSMKADTTSFYTRDLCEIWVELRNTTTSLLDVLVLSLQYNVSIADLHGSEYLKGSFNGFPDIGRVEKTSRSLNWAAQYRWIKSNWVEFTWNKSYIKGAHTHPNSHLSIVFLALNE